MSKPRNRLVALAAVVVLALAAAVTTVVGAHGAQTTADARTAALEAAKTRVPALLSYRVESLASDLAVADQQTTGGFAADYAKILTTVVKPTATRNGISTDAEVSSAGVVSGDADRVVVLVFLTQTTTNRAQRRSVSGSRVEVTMQHTGDTWKIAGLQPV
ncbi:MAG TPA: hypothetical protein VJ872_03385 [Nocardioides sp.]|nr:hypothetical protein [Nocardioides sp.]